MKLLGKVVTSIRITIIMETTHLAYSCSDFTAVRTVLGLLAVFIKSFQSKSMSLEYCPGHLNYLMKNCFQIPFSIVAYV